MEKAIRVGIVGSGNAAIFHYASYLRVTGFPVKVVGVTSLDKAQCKDFAKRRGIQAYDSLSRLLPQVDLIDNCTPGYAHEPVCVAAFKAGKHVVVEKPFTGYYGPSDDEGFEGNRFPKKKMLKEALASARRIIAAALKAKRNSAMQRTGFTRLRCRKRRRFLPRAKARSSGRSGSVPFREPLPAYGIWKLSGGGSIVGKSCHPLSAILYLKQIEGMTHQGKAIRPKTVSARTHEITRNPVLRTKDFLEPTTTTLRTTARCTWSSTTAWWRMFSPLKS